MSRFVLLIISACFLLVGVDVHSGEAQYDPVSMDPPNPDPVYPPVLHELLIPSHDVMLSGIMLGANGAGPHPSQHARSRTGEGPRMANRIVARMLRRPVTFAGGFRTYRFHRGLDVDRSQDRGGVRLADKPQSPGSARKRSSPAPTTIPHDCTAIACVNVGMPTTPEV